MKGAQSRLCNVLFVCKLQIEKRSLNEIRQTQLYLKFTHCSSRLYLSGFIPACSMGLSQVGRMNFGKDVSTLKYFTICGLQEGYEPFAVNTNRDITIWLSKRLPQFLPVPPNHEHIEV